MVLDELYEIQKLLTDEMPEDGTSERKVLDKIDKLIDRLDGDIKPEEKAIMTSIKGSFTFCINQNGLDYNDKEDKKQAVSSLITDLEEFIESNTDGLMSFDYKESDIKIEDGNY